MKLWIIAALASLLAGLLTGCAAVTPTGRTPDEHLSFAHLLENRFGPRPTIVTASDLHRLSDQQLKKFKSYLREPSVQAHPMHERVATYLNRITANFAYDEKTQPASVSLEAGSGNCMSLAVLTTALARAADVDIGYQLVNSSPVFQWQGDLVLKGQHLRSVLFRPELENNNYTFFRNGIRVDYFPGPGERYVRKVAEPEYLSMYYNNLAADALGLGDYNRSWWLLQESIRHLPNNVDALNVFALLYRRSGDSAHAERLYKTSIEAHPDAVVLLRNYRALLRSQNRLSEAEEITHTLASLEGVHPVDWLQAGSVAFRNSEYSEAIRYFKKAVELAPYLHEAYLGLAEAYYAMNDTRQTRRQLELALANANKADTRALYEEKLSSLSKLTGTPQPEG